MSRNHISIVGIKENRFNYFPKIPLRGTRVLNNVTKYMQSILIISNDQKKREKEALLVCEEKSISHFDRNFLKRGETVTKTGDSKKKQSIGIEEVKQMQQKLHLKPSQGSTKAIIIQEAHLLTTEAQNALLKVLEEPPPNTLLILTAQTQESLLPTILSRCQIRNLGQEKIVLTPEETEMFRTYAGSGTSPTAGSALKLAEKLSKNKDDAIVWIEKMIIYTREELVTEISETEKYKTDYVDKKVLFLKKLQKSHQQIKKTNVNLRLTLETLFLQ